MAPNDKFSFYINGDYARNNNPIGGGHANWEGLAFAARYQAAKKVAFAGRAEYFKDAQGFSTGVAQNLGEVTSTGEYKWSDIFLTRLEATRHDQWSSVAFFNDGTRPNSAFGDTTLTLGVVAILGPYK